MEPSLSTFLSKTGKMCGTVTTVSIFSLNIAQKTMSWNPDSIAKDGGTMVVLSADIHVTDKLPQLST